MSAEPVQVPMVTMHVEDVTDVEFIEYEEDAGCALQVRVAADEEGAVLEIRAESFNNLTNFLRQCYAADLKLSGVPTAVATEAVTLGPKVRRGPRVEPVSPAEVLERKRRERKEAQDREAANALQAVLNTAPPLTTATVEEIAEWLGNQGSEARKAWLDTIPKGDPVAAAKASQALTLAIQTHLERTSDLAANPIQPRSKPRIDGPRGKGQRTTKTKRYVKCPVCEAVVSVTQDERIHYHGNHRNHCRGSRQDTRNLPDQPKPKYPPSMQLAAKHANSQSPPASQ